MSEFETQGERGDSGIQGAAGERGPKGDHGQSGATGATGSTGPQGETGSWSWRGWPALRLLAFLLVAAVAAYSLVQVQNESATRTNSLAKERERVGNVFLGTLAQGSVDGCISSNNATYVDRAQLFDGLANAKPQYKQLVQDGTLSQATADRLSATTQKQFDKYLARRKYRDCNQAAARYLTLISNAAYKSEQTAEVNLKANLSSQELTRQEAVDAKQRG